MFFIYRGFLNFLVKLTTPYNFLETILIWAYKQLTIFYIWSTGYKHCHIHTSKTIFIVFEESVSVRHMKYFIEGKLQWNDYIKSSPLWSQNWKYCSDFFSWNSYNFFHEAIHSLVSSILFVSSGSHILLVRNNSFNKGDKRLPLSNEMIVTAVCATSLATLLSSETEW